MTSKRQAMTVVAATAALLVTAGLSEQSRAEPAAARDKDCRATAHSLPGDNNFVYLYDDPECHGAHGAKDDSDEDRDYGDGKGQVKNFDNRTASLINHSDATVEFYTRTGHSDKGDRFCVRPRHYVTKLYMYGDGKAEAGNWEDSISSHRTVDPSVCKRFFGWNAKSY